MKALFLYTELAGYFANCINVYKAIYHAEVWVIYFPINPDAPFEIEMPGIRLINKSTISADALYDECVGFKADVVYVTGWSDKAYKKICFQCRKNKVPVICGVDNVWRGSLRQRGATWFSQWLLKPYFSHLWVAGHRQYEFARRLGYSYATILTDLYVADIDVFSKARDQDLQHYLVFVGRFEKIKGVDLLYKTFSSLSEVERKGWKLRMIGNGSLKPDLNECAEIEVYPFMQPHELIDFAKNAGGFILPSLHEPWGVVVQEFAAAGKPILLSKQVCSGEAYVIHLFNGLRFKDNNPDDLKQTLIKYFALSDDERVQMGKRSAALAATTDPIVWAAKLASVIGNNQNYELVKSANRLVQ
jgi:glycosyltransferase involved in cell wall biosynthesis